MKDSLVPASSLNKVQRTYWPMVTVRC